MSYARAMIAFATYVPCEARSLWSRRSLGLRLATDLDVAIWSKRWSKASKWHPAVQRVKNEGVLSFRERGFRGLLLFEAAQILQEQQRESLLGVVELGGTSGLLPQDVVDVLEGLFKHVIGV